jgi:hypothetical protein
MAKRAVGPKFKFSKFRGIGIFGERIRVLSARRNGRNHKKDRRMRDQSADNPSPHAGKASTHASSYTVAHRKLSALYHCGAENRSACLQNLGEGKSGLP